MCHRVGPKGDCLSGWEEGGRIKKTKNISFHPVFEGSGKGRAKKGGRAKSKYVSEETTSRYHHQAPDTSGLYSLALKP